MSTNQQLATLIN
jgi:hypothetical protein